MLPACYLTLNVKTINLGMLFNKQLKLGRKRRKKQWSIVQNVTQRQKTIWRYNDRWNGGRKLQESFSFVKTYM